MKKHLLSILCLTSLAFPLCAQPASDASLRELITVTGAAKTMDSVYGMMDGLMDQSVPAEALKNFTSEQKAAYERFKQKSIQIIRDEMSWTKMEPMFLEIYRGVFTQEEIDGIIAFHKSPVGQAYVSKVPMLMTKTMEIMQGKMMPAMMGRIQDLGKEFQKELTNAK
ncbi:MAG: DUF2059 domain-containing protein [Verrucomicrobiota bacterium]